MFKKVIIGTLATGIMLSGAGAVFAETPTDTSVKLKIDNKKKISNKYLCINSLNTMKISFHFSILTHFDSLVEEACGDLISLLYLNTF